MTHNDVFITHQGCDQTYHPSCTPKNTWTRGTKNTPLYTYKISTKIKKKDTIKTLENNN